MSRRFELGETLTHQSKSGSLTSASTNEFTMLLTSLLVSRQKDTTNARRKAMYSGLGSVTEVDEDEGPGVHCCGADGPAASMAGVGPLRTQDGLDDHVDRRWTRL